MHGRRRSSREQQWALPATIQTVLEGHGDWDERTHTVWAQYAPGRGMAGGDQGHATARAIDAYQLGRDTVTLIIIANGLSLIGAYQLGRDTVTLIIVANGSSLMDRR